MPGTPITQAEFKPFKEFVENSLKSLNKKMDQIIDPQTGLYKTTNSNKSEIEKLREQVQNIE